ncbi:MAG: redoxin domain-containing protein [Colwellia sp.]|nr:redoxin domain-containing protein [Colwellia sp.]MCW8864377.1 redoxin domain-containing protein [Colwellia sp.]MCW9080790.1 redoxin domain-containing protein [Colwellia sp.]
MSDDKMQQGQKITDIQLPTIDGKQFSTKHLQGKRYLLTFFRFATCPFCNMRLAQLVALKNQLSQELPEQTEIVAIFSAQLTHLQQHANKHVTQLPILADEDNKYYEQFGVKKSLWGLIKGAVLRFPTAIKGLMRGYIPKEISSRLLIMPLSLLVDDEGVIQSVYHGKDEGDHIPLTQVISFLKQ